LRPQANDNIDSDPRTSAGGMISKSAMLGEALGRKDEIPIRWDSSNVQSGFRQAFCFEICVVQFHFTDCQTLLIVLSSRGVCRRISVRLWLR